GVQPHGGIAGFLRAGEVAGGMSVLIRPAEEEDHDVLVAQFQALNVFEEAISGDRRTDRAGAIDSLAEAWRQVRETDGSALVAERDGDVIGHIFLLFPE